MDPESVVFQPRDELWRIQNDMARVQHDYAELIDRVSRLERKHDDDSRLKNVWGASSPFPSVLGGTPQQVPLQQPTAQHFAPFDDHTSALIGNLQLDAEEEPRRIGSTSRANSVRFDETANHGHWAHTSRSSLDLIPRASSSMGGHALSERSFSHKSDGRQSSTGHSVHSAASGHANSLAGSGPALAPGLFILGTVPAIIRCWLGTDFKHESLLYAAVCSGSFTSHLNAELLRRLGLETQVRRSSDGLTKVNICVYLPEAVPISTSSRASSLAPQLPSLDVDFTVVDGEEGHTHPKKIQIFLGSDVLRAQNADVLLSSNQLMLYDDNGNRLQVPLVRPEDDEAFRRLTVFHCEHTAAVVPPVPAVTSRSETGADCSRRRTPVPTVDEQGALAQAAKNAFGGDAGTEEPLQTPATKPAVQDTERTQELGGAATNSQPGAAPSNWNSWRRDSTEKASINPLDWANLGKAAAHHAQQPRREPGIRVLRPSRAAAGTRTASASAAAAAAAAVPVTGSLGQSRFFDDGKRRGEGEAGTATVRAIAERGKEGTMGLQSRAANPVGGASAFGWLNAGGGK